MSIELVSNQGSHSIVQKTNIFCLQCGTLTLAIRYVITAGVLNLNRHGNTLF